jgi:hypothetical protein
MNGLRKFVHLEVKGSSTVRDEFTVFYNEIAIKNTLLVLKPIEKNFQQQCRAIIK